MRLYGLAKFRIQTKMNLHRITLEPHTAAFGEIGRLGFFRKIQEASVKSSRFIFSSCRHGELDVVYSENSHFSVVLIGGAMRNARCSADGWLALDGRPSDANRLQASFQSGRISLS